MNTYLIVGGVAGGASTAARLRRNDESARIIIIEKGHYISYANCGLPYYIGGVITTRDRLFVQTKEQFARRFNLEIRTRQEVISLERVEKRVLIRDLEKNEEYYESYDKLILSPGARPFKPPITGSDLPGVFVLRDVEDTDRIKEYIENRKPEKAIVIGAGYIGIEMVENLHKFCSRVSLVEMEDRILPFFDFEMASALGRHIKSQGIEVYLRERVVSLQERGDSMFAILASGREIEGEIVIFATGVRPDTEWLKSSGLKLSANGSIIVDEYLRTSDENIYAVGDAILTKQLILNRDFNAFLAGPANKQGRAVADNVAGNNMRRFKGALPTAIIRIFKLTAGMVGLSEHQLMQHRIDYIIIATHNSDHAGYYPGASPISLKLLCSPKDGLILGAQIIGYQGVDKRIDVIAAFMQNSGTVYDLTDFEHSYAPPYSSARDPLTLAGYVGENLLNRKFQTISWQDIYKEENKDALLLDIRREEEFECCTIPGSKNIPLDELRERLDELPQDRKIITFCLSGHRSYLACRILLQKGFKNVYNLTGGFKTYQFVYCRDKGADIYAAETIKPDDQIYPDCKAPECPYSY